MKLAAHQPLFLPPLDFFFKMSQVDIFLLADHLQYSTNANFNRGKIKTIDGPAWLTVPVHKRGKSRQTIDSVEIDNHTHWQKQHLRTLCVNYRNAPYFDFYWDQLEEIYEHSQKKLCDLSLELIHFFKSHLFIKTKLIRMSQLNLSGNTNAQLVAAMRQLNCQEYVVEPQFAPFIDESFFTTAGFHVNFKGFESPEYYQQFDGFEAGLSILDLLFNEGEMSFRYLRD